MGNRLCIGNDKIEMEVSGITEDRKTLLLKTNKDGAWMCATMGKEIDIQLAVDITGKDLNVVRQKEVEGKNRWVVVETIKPRKLTRDKVEEVMEAHMQLRDILMPVLKKINYEGQGLKDETELKEHFNIAIIAMARYMEILSEREEWEEAEEQAAKEGKVVKKCPKCGKPMICGEYGDEERYQGGGKYAYYSKCQNCGEEILVNTY